MGALIGSVVEKCEVLWKIFQAVSPADKLQHIQRVWVVILIGVTSVVLARLWSIYTFELLRM